MTNNNEHYDLIIVGTGAGCGTVLHELAPTGKKILVLERGDFLPREKSNWSPEAVYQQQRYYAQKQWCDKNGKVLHPQTCYWVGGNTKVYGAALLQMQAIADNLKQLGYDPFNLLGLKLNEVDKTIS